MSILDTARQALVEFPIPDIQREPLSLALDRLAFVESQNATLQNQVTTLQTQVATLVAQVANLQAENDSLRSRLQNAELDRDAERKQRQVLADRIAAASTQDAPKSIAPPPGITSEMGRYFHGRR